MRTKALVAHAFSPLALSNLAIAWASLLGAVGTIIFVPGQGQGARIAGWLLVALLAQAAYALAVIGLRAARADPGPAYVALALAAGGLARGVTITVSAAAMGLTSLAWPTAAGRALNSVIVCVVGGALIGGTISWYAQFRSRYQLLLDRALILDQAGTEHAHVDPSVLEAWSSMKVDLDLAIDRARALLAAGPTEANLTAAAGELSAEVDANLRPASRAMWQGALPQKPPISLGSLLASVIGTWQLPMREILAFFAVVIGLGAIVRVGFARGLTFTVAYLAVTGVVLWSSTVLARRLPRSAPVIAIATLIGLPVLLFAITTATDNGLPGASTGSLADAIVAVQTPFSTVLVALLVEAAQESHRILDAMQARIDQDVLLIAQREGPATNDARQLSVFLHHSVQSELSALAMQLREAALTRDLPTREAACRVALDRLGQLHDLDAATPPWLRQSSGAERIDEIVSAWDGILTIERELPAAGACRRDQWQVAAQVIEEALANSARHGNASHARIRGTMHDGSLTLAITDNGNAHEQGRTDSAPGSGGMGLQWLDRVAPDDWRLEHTAQGTTLSVLIR